MNALLAEWRARQSRFISLEVRQLHNVDPFSTDPTLPSIAALARATGRNEPSPRGFPAGSDGRLISRLLGCSTVIFGPGDVGRIHKVNEAVDLAEVVAHAEAIENFLTSGADAE
jgi:acetylornithine deacetylase/succinyl-diaminopimelate desuccinylase-like protein